MKIFSEIFKRVGLKQLKENQIIKSSLGLLIITMGVKVLGYIEKVVLAYFLGTSYEVDIYNIVFTIILSFFFLFREIIEPGFLNNFIRLKNEGQDSKAWDLFNASARIILIITLAITGWAVLFPQSVIGIFAPGLDDGQSLMAAKLLQIAIPACVFLCLSTLTNITLNGLRLFVVPTLGDLVFKGMIIVILVIFFHEWGIYGMAVGILVGAMGKLSIHLVLLGKKIHFKSTQVERHNLNSMWKLTWPLLLGVCFSQASSLIDNVFGSYMQEGAISSLSYAKKIIELPILLFPYLLSVVIFPYFSQLSISGKNEKLLALFSTSIQWIVVIFLPLACFIGFFAPDLVKIILERGAFDQLSTKMTAVPLSIYAVGLVFFAIETVLVVFYYSTADTKTPVFVGMICVLLNIALTYIFIRWVGYTGIALAYVVQKILKNIILLYLLPQKIPVNFTLVRKFLQPVLLAFVTVVILMKIFRDQFFTSGNGLIQQIFTIAGVFFIMALVYILLLRAFRFRIKMANLQ